MNVYCRAAFAVVAMLAAGVAPLTGQSIQATVTSIPASATRLVFVVDGSGITSPSPSVRNIVQGTSSVALYLGVPGGASYQLRVVATDAAANLLSSGKVAGISVPAGQSVPVTVALSAVQVTSDASTPGGAGNGTPVTLKFNIADAGSSLMTGSDWCWIDYGTNSSSLFNRAFGDMTAGGDGEVQCSIPLVTPGAGSVLYYRFSTYAQEFLYDHDDPLLAWPSASPATMTLTAPNTIGLTISGIPVSASRVVVLVDGGSLPEPAAAAQNTGGATTLHVTFGVMAGSPYRVRVIAHDAGSKLLSSGMATGVTVTAGASVPVSLTLSDMPAQLDPSTPAAAVAGSQVTVKANITDSGSSLKTGLSQCWIDYGTVSSSLSNRKYGDISRLGGGVDQCVVSLAAPSTGSTLYYTFATYAYEFIYDRISPLLTWPAATPNAISLTGAGAISLSVTNIPSATTRLVAVADNGGVSPVALMAQPRAGGASSAQMTFYIPAGGPYRVRIIAHDAGAAVLSSGMASAITVSAGGSAAASVSLAPVAVALDPSTPATATPGSSITLRFNVTDTGNFIKAGYGYCWIDYSGDPANLSESVFGTVSAAGSGSSQCAVSLTVPSSGSALYYQLGAIGYDFISDQVTPLLEWPTGSALQMGLLTYTPTITTAPEGLSIVVDGASYTAPRTFTWASGSTHTIAVASPQTSGGTRYWLSNWSDGGAISHTVTAPCLAVLQANFTALPAGNNSDFNRDGAPDILWRNRATGADVVWYMNGAEKIGEGALTTIGDANWQLVGSADFNGDGQPDLLWRNTASGEVGYWRMDGINFLEAVFMPTVADLNWRVVGIADFNRDGKPDLIWRNYATGQNRVWYMDGATKLGEDYFLTISDFTWDLVGAADFSGDGKPDLLWRNTATGAIGFWRMDGVTFLEAVFLPTVTDLNWRVAGIADFNQDGKPDLLWRNYATGQNNIWYLDGTTKLGEAAIPAQSDGNWIMGTDLPAAPQVDAQAPQLTISSHSDGQTVGTATVTISGTATDAGRGGNGISAVTVNGAAASGGSVAGTGTANWSRAITLTAGQNTITVVAKDGSAAQNAVTQTIKLNYVAGSSSSATDFNHDGAPDILWRNRATGADVVWYMNGAEKIGEGALTTIGDANWQLVGSADFSGDGQPDLLWRNTATGEVGYWRMDGINFLEAVFMPTVADLNWRVVGIADFNRDGKPDLIWRNYATGQNRVWYMDGATKLGEDYFLTISDFTWDLVGAADFSGDGKPDLLWRNTATGAIGFWRMDGVTFLEAVFLPTVTDLNWRVAGIADFNQDGKPDLLWRNYATGQNNIWYLDGTTKLGEAAIPGQSDGNWIMGTDLPAAPQVDAQAPQLTISSHSDGQTVGTATVTISGTATDAGRGGNGISSVTVNGVAASGGSVTGTGTANWSRAITLTAGQNTITVVAKDGSAAQNAVTQTIKLNYVAGSSSSATDFNHDGTPDILWRNYLNGQNGVWYMNGANKLGEGYFLTIPDLNWKLAGVGDFSGDGKPDLLWRNAVTGEVGYWRMDGITFLEAVFLPPMADLNWKVAGVGDFNGDGKPDIVWRNTATGQNRVWYTSGATKLGEADLPTETDLNWKVAGVGDFNGDGKPDIVWRNYVSGEDRVWYMDGATKLSEADFLAITDLNWKIVGVDDYNGDGKTDLLWRNTATGELGFWRMNGLTFLEAVFLPTVADLNWKTAMGGE